MPHFKEAMDWTGSVENSENDNKVCNFLNEIAVDIKFCMYTPNDFSPYVNCNIPCETMRKYHGANGQNSVKRKHF